MNLLETESKDVAVARKLLDYNVAVNKKNKKYLAVDESLKAAWQEFEKKKDWEKLWRYAALSAKCWWTVMLK